MNGHSVLLGTSVVVRHFRSARLSEKIAAFPYLYLPQPALGELYYGAFKSAHTDRHLKQIQRFLQIVEVLTLDENTASHYGRIACQLAQAGTPIPQNDVWIAALALQYDLPLATADAHFQRVRDLRVLPW